VLENPALQHSITPFSHHRGITTQGDSLAELHAMVADAVNGYFEPAERPARVRLHFVQNPVVSVA
jgi:hypothetical protein